MTLGEATSAESPDCVCRLAKDLLIERFGDRALILLAKEDRFLTVNQAAAETVALMREEFGASGFGCLHLASVLERYYQLDSLEADSEASSLIEEWCKQGILVPCSERGPGED